MRALFTRSNALHQREHYDPASHGSRAAVGQVGERGWRSSEDFSVHPLCHDYPLYFSGIYDDASVCEPFGWYVPRDA